MYLAWFDADRKKPTAQKIAEAHERYVEKFGRQPLVCLVHPEEVVEPGEAIGGAGVEIRPLRTIGRNCFWIGADEADERERESAAPEPAVATAPRRARRKTASIEQPAPLATVPAAPDRARRRKADAPIVAPIAPPSVAPVVEAVTETAPRRQRRVTKPIDVLAEPVAVEIAPAPEPTPAAPKRRTRRERTAA